ncbi:MAG: hypothetical protein PHW75_00635 [Patescibacteria group bacterium]|nr:hypothetical protein [Patescibacteria group bacterium]
MKAKLTKQQIDELWGQDGPYSEVRLVIEKRILDDQISREFLVVETNINPFTFKFIKKNRKLFKDSEMIQQLLNNSEYRGPAFGYVSNAFCGHYTGEDVMEKAEKAAARSSKLIIELHKFVMDSLGIDKKDIYRKYMS